MARNPEQYVYAMPDAELEQQLREGIEASNDDFALHIQLQQVLPLSEYTFAYELQLPEVISFSSASIQRDEHFQIDNDPQKQVNCGGGERRKGKEVDSGLEWLEYIYETSESVCVELCGICFEDSLPEMFEGLNCLHRYCHSCMTRYIHSRIEDRRPQIYCPHESCGEPLTPQECAYFLPAEIFDAWSALNLEAQIADCEKVHCPFPDCSALLVKEETEMSMLSAECCCFCNRMFCLRCKVPWHADLDCSEFQNLPLAERSEADLQLFKLAEDRKWQRCGKCAATSAAQDGLTDDLPAIARESMKTVFFTQLSRSPAIFQ